MSTPAAAEHAVDDPTTPATMSDHYTTPNPSRSGGQTVETVAAAAGVAEAASASAAAAGSEGETASKGPAPSGPINPATAAIAATAAAAAQPQPQPHQQQDEEEEDDEDETDTPDENPNKKSTGWLVTSCDVGTTEPQSLSQELERLQVLKSYHIMDPERDESFDRLNTMASRVLDTPFTFLSLVDMGRIWFRCNPESDCEAQLTRDILSCLSRVILKHNGVFVIPDINQDEMFRQGDNNNSSTTTSASASAAANPNTNTNSNTSTTTSTSTNPSSSTSATADPPNPLVQFRFFAGAPLMSPEGFRLGAFCLLGTEPRPHGLAEDERENLKDFAKLAVQTMVDRRKLTTQGGPSHLVACTAHDLITPLTGIQLSLSLLQQDGDFQAKLGDKRKEHISAAVRSSNMMLRICQSTIETLRGNRKIPAATDWSLPRNLMQIAEASPFIDMREFADNLEAISNSIPKRVPLTISLHPSAPTNIVSDGLKVFRSALNLLSNACSRTNEGSISMTIYDDQDGSLVFECEDTGPDVEIRDSQALFSQDNDASTFGLYSVAYQISWLGGKFGVRRRDNLVKASGSLLSVNGGAAIAAAAAAASARSPTQGKSGHKGSIFWFSIPIVLPQDVSELMGLAKSLSDGRDLAGIPTFKADLPATPPASPQVEDYHPENHDNNNDIQSPGGMPLGVVKQGEVTRTLNALIIEDSTTVRKILGRALSKLGYQVYEAADGMEGLRELKATLFDMVLCDFLMPVMDGLDCVKQYREWEAVNRRVFRQYIVGISAHASRNDIERGLKLGMDDFKPKPIVLKTLTGLHESQALREVRANLDNLLNLPSLEVKRQDQDVVTGAPAGEAGIEEFVDNRFVLFDTAKVENNDNKTGGAKSSPLFTTANSISAAAANTKSEAKKPPLFSIATNLDPSDAGKQQEMKKQAPLFSIATNLTHNNETKKPALFSIATNLDPLAGQMPNDVQKPGALFSISIKAKEESNSEKPQETSKPPLFPVVAKQNPPDGEKKVDNVSAFSDTNPGQSVGKALFSIATNLNATRDGGKQSDSTFAGGDLFAVSAHSEKAKEAKPSPLFPAPSNAMKTDEGQQSGQAKPALFSIIPTTTEEKKSSSLSFPQTAENNAETESQNAKQNMSLLNISPTIKPGESYTGNTQQRAKRPPNFDVSSQGESGGKEGSINSTIHEGTDGESRPRKTMKRTALFDIATSDRQK